MDRYASVETALREVAGSFRYPPTPDLSTTVVQRIAALPRRRRPGNFWARPSRISYAVALVVLLLTAALLVPGLRETVAGWVRVHGLVINRVPAGSLPSPANLTASPGDARDALERALQLKGRTTIGSARSRAGFRVLAPGSTGGPSGVYLEPTRFGSQATLLYYPRPGLPPSNDPRVGLLISEIRATVDSGLIQKFVEGDQTTIEPVTVRGVQGFWISGHPHAVVLQGADGTYSPAGLRLAGSTLLWEQGGVTYRLESGLDRAGALAVAESLR